MAVFEVFGRQRRGRDQHKRGEVEIVQRLV